MEEGTCAGVCGVGCARRCGAGDGVGVWDGDAAGGASDDERGFTGGASVHEEGGV